MTTELADLKERIIELEETVSKGGKARQLLIETNLRLQESTQQLNIVKEKLKAEITERKLAEEFLRKSNADLQDALKKLHDTQEQMIHQERLSALGRMASGIAHDFNNVLTPILGLSNLLLESPEILAKREEALAMLRDIRTSADDAKRMVDRIRQAYKASGETDYGSVDILSIIDTVVSLTRPKWKDEMRASDAAIQIRLEAKKRSPATRAIMLTGFGAIMNDEGDYPKGTDMILSKPVTRQELRRAIAEVMAGADK